MKLIRKNKKGQALVEYVFVLAIMAVISVWAISILKCTLHGFWVSISCDIVYPYPLEEESNAYCQKIKDCFSI